MRQLSWHARTPFLNKATLCTQLLEELFFSFLRSAWECRLDARRGAGDAERPTCIPTQSVNAIKLSRVGVQTFRFGRNGLR